MLTGITLIKDGNRLKYPWKQCIKSLCSYCDDVLLNIGQSTDDTELDSATLAQEHSNLNLHSYYWSMGNSGDGRELAHQANNLLKYIRTEWVIYLQSDELLLQQDGLYLKRLVEELPSDITQIELYRTYFWGSLDKRAPEHEIFLGRMFKKGTHLVGGDGMYLIRNQGEVYRTTIPIYHYSRIGEEKDVTNRIRNLDLLFHPSEEVATYKDFNYNECKSLIPYIGKHPEGIEEFYKK